MVSDYKRFNEKMMVWQLIDMKDKDPTGLKFPLLPKYLPKAMEFGADPRITRTSTTTTSQQRKHRWGTHTAKKAKMVTSCRRDKMATTSSSKGRFHREKLCSENVWECWNPTRKDIGFRRKNVGFRHFHTFSKQIFKRGETISNVGF